MVKKEKEKVFVSEELELPETLYIRDIEDQVFQGIVLQTLRSIEGIALCGGTFMGSIFGRETKDRYKGISIAQDNKTHSVSVKVDISIFFGVVIPDKAEEIQNKISQEITRQTGLHVSCVHVVIRQVVLPDRTVSLPQGKNDTSESETNFPKIFDKSEKK
ncbi:MAG: hypothetical protein Tsb0021_15870 [Chlamydiales bacterium]